MYKSLLKLKKLPTNTKIYCAHEYTEQNLNFASYVEPSNADLLDRLKRVKEQRQQNQITLPSSIGEELKTNPFLRCDNKNIRESIFSKYNVQGSDTEIFEAVRNWKDVF
jgi:hydroxyacylglutathione hydrolase